jgi:periplasmic mercuric ion binding protein
MRKLICASVVLAFAAVSQAEELKLNIDGMTCEVGCVKKVRDTLTKVKGVNDKKVELGKATIDYDAKKTSKETIVAAIEKAGFKVK